MEKPKKITKKSKSPRKVKKENRSPIDGFTNEERLKLDKKVIDFYYKLFNNHPPKKKYHGNKRPLYYPMDDPRTIAPVKWILEHDALNKDGSLKNRFKKLIEACKKKQLYSCKR